MIFLLSKRKETRAVAPVGMSHRKERDVNIPIREKMKATGIDSLYVRESFPLSLMNARSIRVIATG